MDKSWLASDDQQNLDKAPESKTCKTIIKLKTSDGLSSSIGLPKRDLIRNGHFDLIAQEKIFRRSKSIWEDDKLGKSLTFY